jgi:glycosyltransferase involved in cell wall biosynthesis
MKRRRVRVLHVIQNLNYGGMERVLADIVIGSDPERFESHVLCLQYLGRFSEGLENAASLHVAEPMGRGSLLRPVTLTRQIARLAPDVVHSHSGVWYKASLAARRAGVRRVVHTEHGRAKPDPIVDRIVDGLAAQRTDVVVAVSERLADGLPSALWINRSRVTVIHNGIDTSAYRPRTDGGELRRELGLSATTQVLGSIGRLEPIKGYDVMIEAFARLRRTDAGRDVVLVLAGEGSQRPELERLVTARDLGGLVHFLGWRDDVHALQSTFQVFTMSSHSEGTSISLLEAMSAGLPPVVTDVGGNRSVLGPLLAHCLVPGGDPVALAERWSQSLADAGLRARDAKFARERVVTSFGRAAMVEAYERVYCSSAAQQGAR